MFYYAHFLGGDKNIRDKYKDHPYFQSTLNFCSRWDQASFDPNYDTIPLKDFKNIVGQVFSRKPYIYL